MNGRGGSGFFPHDGSRIGAQTGHPAGADRLLGSGFARPIVGTQDCAGLFVEADMSFTPLRELLQIADERIHARHELK
jgi:hypothetical protein